MKKQKLTIRFTDIKDLKDQLETLLATTTQQSITISSDNQQPYQWWNPSVAPTQFNYSPTSGYVSVLPTCAIDKFFKNNPNKVSVNMACNCPKCCNTTITSTMSSCVFN